MFESLVDGDAMVVDIGQKIALPIAFAYHLKLFADKGITACGSSHGRFSNILWFFGCRDFVSTYHLR